MTALYVHIPFCSSVCNYCDFCAMPVPQRVHEEYIDFLLRELSLRKKDMKFETVYLGGGSPSVLSPNVLKKLLRGLCEVGELHGLLEWTMEWNPEHTDFERIKIALDFGINRFSLGVQSLNDSLLSMLGRKHNADIALEAFKRLKGAGFNSGNVDLMFALPNQSVEDFLHDVRAFAEMGIEHLSFYGLSVAKRTPFGQANIQPQDDFYPEMYLKAIEILEGFNIKRYEVSNCAKQGYESKHNLTYWQRKPYLGIGLSAHSFLNGIRYSNSNRYAVWKNWVKNGCNDSDGLTIDVPGIDGEKMEFIWLSLRMHKGLDILEYEQLFKEPFNLNRAEEFINREWITRNGNNLQLRGEGWLWLDKIAVNLATYPL